MVRLKFLDEPYIHLWHVRVAWFVTSWTLNELAAVRKQQ